MILQTEHFPAGFDYRARFPDLGQVAGLEGGSIYVGTAAGRPVVVTEESTMLDLLDDEDVEFFRERAVAVHYFGSVDERDQYVDRKYKRRSRREWDVEDDPEVVGRTGSPVLPTERDFITAALPTQQSTQSEPVGEPQEDLYDTNAEVYAWALDQLRELLIDIGFKVHKRAAREKTLRVYPIKSLQYPLLNPGFRLMDEEDDREPLELLEMVVLAKGLTAAIEERLLMIQPDARCRFFPDNTKEGEYVYLGSVLLPLTFHSDDTRSLDFEALRAPLQRVYHALALGVSDAPPSEGFGRTE